MGNVLVELSAEAVAWLRREIARLGEHPARQDVLNALGEAAQNAEAGQAGPAEPAE